jgi:hypothetical protein
MVLVVSVYPGYHTHARLAGVYHRVNVLVERAPTHCFVMSGDAVDATLGPEYRLIRQIGQGAFGRALLVERAVEPNAGDTFVIKQINVVAMGDKARREAEQEVKVCLAVVWVVKWCRVRAAGVLDRC